MRIKSFFLGMLLMCSMAVLPAFSQDDSEEPVAGETPEFTLESSQAISVEGDGDDAGVREATDMQAEMEATGALYIIIRGRFVYAVWNGRVLVIVCRRAPSICAIIKIRVAAANPAPVVP